MIGSINNVEKGLYIHPQPQGFLVLKEYVLSSEENGRCLLLRFHNESSLTVTAMSFIVSMIDTSGRVKAKVRIDAKRISISPGAQYIADKPIYVGKDCADFMVRVISFDSGRYRYKLHNNQYNAYFLVREEKHKRGGYQGRASIESIKRPGQKLSAAIALLSVIAICLCCFFIRLKLETEAQDTAMTAGYSAQESNSSAVICR